MSFSFCKIIYDFNDIKQMKNKSINTVEMNGEIIANLSNEEFSLQQKLFSQENINLEICSSILGNDVFVSEMGFNIYVWTEYLKKTIDRLASLGCKKIIWSNGKSRVVPIEGDINEVEEQIMQFVYMLCNTSASYNIDVLIEPLGNKKTNYLNDLEEMKDFFSLITADNLYSTISLRELEHINLKIEDIHLYKSMISHIYLDNPEYLVGERISPKTNDKYNYSYFLSTLKNIDYSQSISIPKDTDNEFLEYCHQILN